MKIGIIFAMEEELNALREHLSIDNESSLFNLKFYEASVSNVKCILVESGIGKVNAARTTQILIDNMKVDYIFNIGVAGGIDSSLNVSDVVVGTKLVQHDFDITAFNHEKGYIPDLGKYIYCDEYLVRLVKEIDSNILSGVIASGDIFCTDDKMAGKIHNKFDALCVEMEGASIAQVCYLCNIPFLIIRSISDTPNNKNAVTFDEFLNMSSKKVADVMMKLILKLSNESTISRRI